ncbi:MAG: glyoxylate/hydroxypyruvate reductase A [Amylibacter sp.]|nr:glyoxylate/hydroxypyruvate reductase A [Amylibacter sp.]
MTKTVLFSAPEASWQNYKPYLDDLFEKAGLDINLVLETDAPQDVDYIIYAPNGPVKDFAPFTNVKLVQSLWAGVETALTNKTLTQPLARMVDPGMSEGMADYVVGHVMRHHLGTALHVAAKPGEWLSHWAPPLARNRTVGFLGIGALGLYCAHKTAKQGFNVVGWSRTLKADDVVKCYAGKDGLRDVLAQSDILVLLLPDTPETTNMINADSIAQMKDGAAIINPGRGPLIDDTALLKGLDSGKLSGATLDVFRVEPLPANDPYWIHPKVLVTPHIASETRLETSAAVVVENIGRGEAGQSFLHLVDRKAGY